MSSSASTVFSTRVLRLRLKDKHAPALRAMARDVNLVWNYCNELSAKVLEREQRFASAFELQKYLNGASKEGLSVGSAVFQQVAEEFATRRRQFKKRQLRWRVSNPKRSNYSLGWIPFKARSLSYKAGQLRFQGLTLSLWDSYGLADYELGAGCLSEDARGGEALLHSRVQPGHRQQQVLAYRQEDHSLHFIVELANQDRIGARLGAHEWTELNATEAAVHRQRRLWRGR